MSDATTNTITLNYEQALALLTNEAKDADIRILGALSAASILASADGIVIDPEVQSILAELAHHIARQIKGESQ